MQRTASPIGHQRELARIMSSLDQDDADRPLHLRFDHAKYSCRKLRCAFQRTLLVIQNCFGSSLVKVHAAAEKGRLIETTQQEVRVGYGGLDAASKADWSWIRTRRFRSHAQHASCIEACNRTTAGSRSMNIEHRYTDGHTGHDGFACLLHASAGRVRQKYVGRRAAHVDSDDLFQPCPLRNLPRADHASRRTGENRAYGLPGRDTRWDDAAGGLHHLHASAM